MANAQMLREEIEKTRTYLRQLQEQLRLIKAMARRTE